MVSTLRTPGAADQLLIEEVRIHEVLYACPTKSNKDNQLRDVAWQEIADAVGKTVDEAKERWRYMRDKYVKELGRNDKNGTSTTDHPPDSFFGLMSFLNPFIKRKSSSHSNGANNNRASSSNEHHHFEISLNPHEIDSEFHSDDDRQNSEGGGNIEFVSSVSDDGMQIPHMSNGNRAIIAIKRERAEQRRQSQNNGEICALPIAADVSLLPAKRARIMHQQEDSTTLFCASIAGMLNELQPYHRERIKRDIYNLVSDALLTELSN